MGPVGLPTGVSVGLATGAATGLVTGHGSKTRWKGKIDKQKK